MNQGSIDQTGSGKYRVRVRAEGKRITLGSFDDLESAETMRLAALRELAGRARGADESLAKYGERFLRESKLRDKENDLANWHRYVTNDEIGAMDLGAVKRPHVVLWTKRLAKRGLSRSFRVKILGYVRRVLGDALDVGHLRSNVAIDVRIPPEPKSNRCDSYLTIEQVRALVAVLEPGFERCVTLFALATGLRESELATLRLVDVHDRFVTVRYGSTPKGNVEEPKGGPTKSKQVRDVHLVPLARVVLDEWLPWLALRKNPHGLLFPRLRGEYLDPKHILRWARWKEIREKIDRPDLRWHDLRHTAASALLSGYWGHRWSLAAVQAFLGHAEASTTEIYAHLAPTVNEAEVDETWAKLGPRAVDPRPSNSNATSENDSSTPDKSRTCDLRFRNPPVSREILEGFGLRGPVAAHAVDLAHAVDAGDEVTAGEHADAIARGVLDSTVVRLARSVLERGPLATASALRLARWILESTESVRTIREATS